MPLNELKANIDGIIRMNSTRRGVLGPHAQSVEARHDDLALSRGRRVYVQTSKRRGAGKCLSSGPFVERNEHDCERCRTYPCCVSETVSRIREGSLLAVPDLAPETTDPPPRKAIGTFDDWVKAYQGLGSPEANLKPPRLGFAKDLAVKAGHIAFSRSGDIFTMDLATGVETQLTRKAQRNVSPEFLADGKRIAFLSNRDGMAWRVYIMNLDGTDQRPITRTFAVWYGAPSFAITPDGAHVAYIAATGAKDVWPHEQLHLVDVTRGDDQPIGELDDLDKPAFVPGDPTLLYVVAGGFDREHLISVDVETKRLKRLPHAGNHLFSGPRKLGDQLLFAAGPTGAYCCRESRLFTTTLDGGRIKQLGTFWVSGSMQPEISPHSSKIAIEWSVREGGFGADWRNEISLLNADGGFRRSLTALFPRPFYSAFEPAWAPDDRHIAFTLSLCPYAGCEPTIRSVVVVDTKDPKGVPAFIAYGGEPSWSAIP